MPTTPITADHIATYQRDGTVMIAGAFLDWVEPLRAATTVHGSLPRAARNATPRMSFSTRWLGDDVVYRPDELTARLTERLNHHPALRYGEPPPASAIPISWPPAP